MLKRLLGGAKARRTQAGSAGAPSAELDALLSVARQSFVQVQAAWDAADLHTLASFTTEPLLADLRSQLHARGPGPNCTEVLSLPCYPELSAVEIDAVAAACNRWQPATRS